MPREAGIRLKARLDAPKVALLPGGYSPVIARMLEQLGFDGLFMAGSQTNIYEFALPDVGLISMREMVDAARRITAASNLPVFMDGDTGYGNVLNVYRTVQEAAWAGVACMSLEDQEAPKKSGTSAGRRCITQEEAVGKVQAAVAARDAGRRAQASKWGAISPQSLLYPDAAKILDLEAKYLPKEQQRDYESTWGHPTQS